MRWGTLERVPHTPQNFSRTDYYWWEPTFAPGSSFRLRSCMEALAIPAAVVPEGGACLLCCPPALPLVCFFAPIPPAPFPVGRGRPRFFSCKGLRPLHPRGCTRAALAIPAAVAPEGGLPCWSPAAPAFSLPACPHPPSPLPGGKGETQSLFRRGLRPRHPGIKPPAALTDLAKQVPGATESLRFNAKPKEPPFHEQCRQPRRGGTGGEELRRLRWSSPPGQG